jgi:hypothetical protein
MKPPSRPEERGARDSEAGEAVSGFAMLSNRFITNAVLAHLRADAVKVYLALLLAARNKTRTCWPGVKTLARWSGVPRGKVSKETEYLARHRLIVKDWIQISGKPRMSYHIVSPEGDMFPDLRGSCAVCMNTDHRGSCVLQDPKTGRLLGRRPRPGSTDHRDSHSTDHRDSHMFPDNRGSNHTEPYEKVLSIRGEGEYREGEPDGGLRSASPLGAAPLRPPSLEADPTGERKAAWEGKNREQPETAPETRPKPPTAPETLSSLPPLPVPPVDEAARRRTRLRELLAPRPGQDVSYYVLLAQKAKYPEAEIRSVLAELAAAATPPAPVVAPPPGDGTSQTFPPIETPRPPVPVPRRRSSGRKLCAAETRAHSECGLWALPGSAFCRRHGGQGKSS